MKSLNKNTSLLALGVVVVVAILVVFTTGNKSVSWPVYENTEYGFQLILPESWKGAEVDLDKDVDPPGRAIVHFMFDTSDGSVEGGETILMSILVFDKASFNPNAAASIRKLGENSEFVFGLVTFPNLSSDLTEEVADMTKVINSFAAVSPQ